MKAKSDPNAFPSLFARLTSVRHNAFTVTCTATQRVIGEVFWTATGSTVTWTFRAATTGESGDRSTKRGAIQSLRDIANGEGMSFLPFEDVAPTPTPRSRPAVERQVAAPARQAPATPAPAATPVSQKVQWGDYATRTDINVADLTSSIAAAFDRHKRK